MAGRNVRQGFGATPADFYYSLPPITRLYATSAVAATVAVSLGLVSPYTLMLHWPSVFKLQVWRLLTNFVFLGGFSMKTVIQIIWILTYSKPLEAATYQFNPADYIFMLLVGMVSMLAATFIPFFNSPFLASPLVFMLLYVWSREFPTNNVSIWGLFNVQAFYLPFCFLGLNVMLGGNWVADLLGILAGHLYYFLKVLHPAAGGQDLLKTPAFLTRWVQQAGIGNPAVRPAAPPGRQQAQAAPAAPTGFRAFGGTGRRLNG
ncbi:hypothetical protein WJX72_002204 [[Myrmecia] bisecta]|uniref:Derlin n=1 Tax=[Myrmecia] bisecta TaxID=41462 RepID=A0AAW1Q184_9CHLO